MFLFEKAARCKLRFVTERGILATEDLWDLPLTNPSNIDLDKLAVGLHKELENTNISFVENKTPENETLQLKFDIVKHIIDTKLKEQKEQHKAASLKMERQRILERIEELNKDDLNSKSREELEEMLKNLSI